MRYKSLVTIDNLVDECRRIRLSSHLLPVAINALRLLSIAGLYGREF